MSDFKTRLKDEGDDLADRLEKLTTYISRDFPGLTDERQKELLREQQVHMTAYLNVLFKRLQLIVEGA